MGKTFLQITLFWFHPFWPAFQREDPWVPGQARSRGPGFQVQSRKLPPVGLCLSHPELEPTRK